MRNKGDEKFYRKLPRKELQGLCKKYGLPARKSSSEMAKSLASYFENMSSKSTGYRLDKSQEASLSTFMTTGLPHGAPFRSSEDLGTDNNGFHFCSREEGKGGRCSFTVRSNELGNCVGDKAFDKETSKSPFPSQCDRSNFNKDCPRKILCENCSGIATDGRGEDICMIQHTDVNLYQCPRENSLPSSSFEFYVHSEEGIKLCVDLSSSPSDWIKKLKSEVNICENISHNKAPSFHQELGCLGENHKQNKSSFLLNIDAHQSKDSNMQSASSASLPVNENKHVVHNHPDGADVSLTSIEIKPCGIPTVFSEHVQEDQGVVSSEPNSDTRDGIHHCTDENGCVTTLDSDVNTSRKELAGNSVVYTSDYPISHDSFEHQKPSNENCEYSTQEKSCNLVSSQLEISGSTASSSGEVPLSEVEIQRNGLCIHCKNGEFLDSVYPTGNTETEHSGVANSCEPELDICWNNLPTPAEELERSKLIDGGEGSESSQFVHSFEKAYSSLDNMESDKEVLKKRPRMENDDQPDLGRTETKILGSLKNFATKVLPRRSMRLVSK